ncbi:hypothetical protein AJ87_37355 [Rhizobium yanglingense]|nr:hypothetical protein AJ87_37355 [Rhizobium yanglingense]
MNVLDDHDERHLPCQILEQPSQRLEQPRSCDARIKPFSGLAKFGKKPRRSRAPSAPTSDLAAGPPRR